MPPPHLPRGLSQFGAPPVRHRFPCRLIWLKGAYEAEARALRAISKDQQLQQWHFLNDLAGERIQLLEKRHMTGPVSRIRPRSAALEPLADSIPHPGPWRELERQFPVSRGFSSGSSPPYQWSLFVSAVVQSTQEKYLLQTADISGLGLRGQRNWGTGPVAQDRKCLFPGKGTCHQRGLPSIPNQRAGNRSCQGN